MSFADRLTEDRRRMVLALLQESPDFRLAERALKAALDHVGSYSGSDQVRAALGYLEEHGLVRVEKLAQEQGDLWVATLREAGQDVLRGRAHPGVARLAPR